MEVEVWRAAWIAVSAYMADIGEEAFLGRLDTIYCNASRRKTGEAVKRLSNPRYTPGLSPPSPSHRRIRAGTAGQAGLGRNGEASSFQSSKGRGSSPDTWGRGGRMVRTNWEAGARSRPFPRGPRSHISRQGRRGGQERQLLQLLQLLQ